MTFRDDAITATESVVDALGEPVIFQSNAGEQKTITAAFEKEFMEHGLGVGVNTALPVLFVKESDGPFSEGDTFIIDDITYRQVRIEPDADGAARIELEKHRG